MPGVVAAPTEQELDELARSLETNDIPSKLRCGICDLLAWNTMRLGCCNQNICDKCYDNELVDECLICSTKPLDKSACEENRNMRMTVMAFVKKKFLDRAKKQGGATDKTKTLEAVKAAAMLQTAKVQEANAKKAEIAKAKAAAEEAEAKANGAETNATKDNTPKQGEKRKLSELLAERDGEGNKEDQDDDDKTEWVTDYGSVEIIVEHESPPYDPIPTRWFELARPEQHAANLAREHAQKYGYTYNPNQIYDTNQMNGMPDFSSLMSNPLIQNMMANMNMMPGMMPAMMQQMLQGYDMSQIMAGMNMGGMNGYNNGSWNNQGNYHNNSYGNYGSNGYQSNYNQMNEQSYANNDYQQRGYSRQGFQNRRGRRGYYNGGYGRGGYQQGNNNQYGHSNQNQFYQQQQDVQPTHGVQQEVQAPKEKPKPATREPPRELTQEEKDREALYAKMFAPGGEHDFDEELGRTPPESDTEQQKSDHTADTSIESESIKDTSATEIPEAPVQEKKKNEETRKVEEKMVNEEISEKIAEKVQDKVQEKTEVNGSKDHDNVEAKKHDNIEVKHHNRTQAEPVETEEPRPIEAFVSDEPRLHTPISIAPLAPVTQINKHISSAPITTTTPITTESRGIGVVGAPTGPRAFRNGASNTGRGGFRYGQSAKPASITNNEHVQSPLESPAIMQRFSRQASPVPTSRARSRSPKRHHSSEEKNFRSRTDRVEEQDQERSHHRSHRRREIELTEEERPSKSSRHRHDEVELDDSSRRSKHRTRRHHEEEQSAADEGRHSKRSHREHEGYGEDERQKRSGHEEYVHEEYGHEERHKRSHHDYNDHAEEDTHRRSSRRSRHHHEEEVESSSRRRHHERSRSPEHRSSGQDRHRHREERQEERFDRRVSYPEQEPIPAAAREQPRLTEEPVRSSRKRRTQEFVEDLPDDSPAQKRARHSQEQTPSTGFNIRGASKPNTPITPSFPTPTGPSSRRDSGIHRDTPSTLPKPTLIPTGPRAGNDRKPSFRATHPQPESITTKPAPSNLKPSTKFPPIPKPTPVASAEVAKPTSNPATKPIPAPDLKKPTKDPHTLEREARDRERLQREMQRRAFGGGGKKPSISAPTAPANSNKGGSGKIGGAKVPQGPISPTARRVSYKYEDEGGYDARRIEKEREGGRWR